MRPRISVIVIGYNIEQYISQCLESILAQDYDNFELIFVDDGSRDNTLKTAQKFSGDSRVKIIHKDNGGCVSARKAGVREAKGEYSAKALRKLFGGRGGSKPEHECK